MKIFNNFCQSFAFYLVASTLIVGAFELLKFTSLTKYKYSLTSIEIFILIVVFFFTCIYFSNDED